jgi:hypothetical protein
VGPERWARFEHTPHSLELQFSRLPALSVRKPRRFHSERRHLVVGGRDVDRDHAGRARDGYRNCSSVGVCCAMCDLRSDRGGGVAGYERDIHGAAACVWRRCRAATPLWAFGQRMRAVSFQLVINQIGLFGGPQPLSHSPQLRPKPLIRHSQFPLPPEIPKTLLSKFECGGCQRTCRVCTGSGCLDTLLQLRQPASSAVPDGLRGVI